MSLTVDEVKHLEVQPGDVLVVRMNDPEPHYVDAVRDKLQEWANERDVTVMLVGPGADIEVRKGVAL